MLEIILIAVVAVLAAAIFYYIGKMRTNSYWKAKESEIRADAIARSRAVLSGQFSEQLAPYLPDFKWSPTETKYVGGKPIDFIVFKGLDQKNVEEVVFIEVKSGKSRLSTAERTLKDTISNKKVSWEEYRVPQDITSRNQKSQN